MALEFGVCMCYFSNIKLAKFCKKKDQIWIFHDLVGARPHSQKSSEKKNSSLIVTILQYTKNLWFKFFLEYNKIRNFKIVWLSLYNKELLEIQK